MNNQQQLEHVAPAFVDFDCITPSMQELILDYLGMNTEATFIDLEDDVPGFAGDLPLRSSSNRNTILWQGLSQSAVHALHEMDKQGKIQFQETSFAIYRHKGRRLNLPIGSWDSSKPHWTPVVVQLKAGNGDAATLNG